MKTAISIPDSIFQMAEAMAGELKLSRSELFTRAVEEYIEKYKYSGVTESLNAVYKIEDEGLDSALSDMQTSSIDQEEW